jgi:hypothetical protein
MKKEQKSKFEGWDWSELVYHFGLEPGEFDPHDMEAEAKPLREYLNKIYKNLVYEQLTEKDKQDILDCREYLEAFIECGKKIHFGMSIYKGLSKVKEDETFLIYFNLLINYMWV